MDHLGSKTRIYLWSGGHRAKTAGRAVKNAIVPVNWAQTLAGTTKELVYFNSLAAGPHKHVNRGTDGVQMQ